MHMADALVSPEVAGVAYIISGTLFVIAAKKVKENINDSIIPLMGVMGAFIFATQMINFSVPGTGSSGHIIGGILLSAILGPWAAFITLTSVLIIQCLIFADGGLMALGCNILNMAVTSCLIAYPLVFIPLVKNSISYKKIIFISVLSCATALEIGAFLVTLETELSGITALPFSKFLLFMLPIHLLIGIIEGLATGSAIYFINKYNPEIIIHYTKNHDAIHKYSNINKTILIIILLSFIFGLSFKWLASTNPDGLEWSISKVTDNIEVNNFSEVVKSVQNIQETTAIIPEYNNSLAGIIGGIIVVVVIWGAGALLKYRKKIIAKHNE